MTLKQDILAIVSSARWPRPVLLGSLAMVALAASLTAGYFLFARTPMPAPTVTELMVIDRKPYASAQPVVAETNVTGASASKRLAGGATMDTSEAGLSRALQAGLRRAGCFDGAVNGVWSRQSAEAMGRFLAVANASLPVDRPDPILLALIESHTSIRCATTQTAAFVPEIAKEAPTAAARLDRNSARAEMSDLQPPLPLPQVNQRAIPSSTASALEANGPAPLSQAAPLALSSAPQTNNLPNFAPGPLAAPSAESPTAERASRRAHIARYTYKPIHRSSHRRASTTTFGSISKSVTRNFKSFTRAISSIVN